MYFFTIISYFNIGVNNFIIYPKNEKTCKVTCFFLIIQILMDFYGELVMD